MWPGLPVTTRPLNQGPGMQASNALFRRPCRRFQVDKLRVNSRTTSAIPRWPSVGLTEPGGRPLQLRRWRSPAFFRSAELDRAPSLKVALREAPSAGFCEVLTPPERTRSWGHDRGWNNAVNCWLEIVLAMKWGWPGQDPRQHPWRIPPLLRPTKYVARKWKRNHAPPTGPATAEALPRLRRG